MSSNYRGRKEVPITAALDFAAWTNCPKGSRRLKNSLKHTLFEVGDVGAEPYAMNVAKVRHGSDLIGPHDHQSADWWNGPRPLCPGSPMSHRRRHFLPFLGAELRRCRTTLRTPRLGSPVPRRLLQKPLLGHGVSGKPKGKALNSPPRNVETAYSPDRPVP
jgi:hypothetical protein